MAKKTSPAVKTSTTAASPKVEPMTTKKPADGLRSKAEPRNPDRTKKVSRAAAGLGRATICRVELGSVPDLEKWIAENLSCLANETPKIVTSRVDGRKVAVFNLAFTVDLALALIKINAHNRAYRPHHAQLHAEKFRLPSNDQNGFDSDISQCAIFFEYDEETGLLTVSALADGQHRASAKIAADGTFIQYHEHWHYMECHRMNLDKPAEECRSLDWVSVKVETDYTDETTGQECSGYLIPIAQWRKKVADARQRGDAGVAALDSLTNGRDAFTNWKLREELGADAPEESCPMIVLLVGADRRTLSKHDQNNLARTGGDELDMNTTTGPQLRKIGLPAETAATLVRNIWLRIKPQSLTTTQEIDRDGNTYTVERLKRGELSDGGKPIAPPSYPAYFQSPEIGPRIEAVWQQWQRLRAIAGLWKDTDPTCPKHPKHEANEVAHYARIAAGWDREKRTRTAGSGYMIGDQLVLLAACLIESRNCGKTADDYRDEVADFISRAAFGVAVEDGKYIPDGVFTDSRQFILDKRENGGTYKAGELLDQLARDWNHYQGFPLDELDAPERFHALDPETGEYIGADLDGLGPDAVKQIQASQRGAEFVPGRKRGRPPVGLGNGTKKKARKVS